AAESHPLDEAQQGLLPGLLERLGDDSYQVRERATLDLLLFPQGVVKDLDQLVESSEDSEVRARAAWLLREMRGGEGPALAYLSRITGISKPTLRGPLLRGGEALEL